MLVQFSFASPHIRWSLMQSPLMDPEFQQLWQVLSTFWRMVHQFPLVLELWLQSSYNPGFSSQGPLHAVVQCLVATWTGISMLSCIFGFSTSDSIFGPFRWKACSFLCNTAGGRWSAAKYDIAKILLDSVLFIGRLLFDHWFFLRWMPLNSGPPSKMVPSSRRRPRRTLTGSIRGYVTLAKCLILSRMEPFIVRTTSTSERGILQRFVCGHRDQLHSRIMDYILLTLTSGHTGTLC